MWLFIAAFGIKTAQFLSLPESAWLRLAGRALRMTTHYQARTLSNSEGSAGRPWPAAWLALDSLRMRLLPARKPFMWRPALPSIVVDSRIDRAESLRRPLSLPRSGAGCACQSAFHFSKAEPRRATAVGLETSTGRNLAGGALWNLQPPIQRLTYSARTGQ